MTDRASCEAQTGDFSPPPKATIDHPLSAESNAATRQILDLKLQLAECLAENDTLKHRNSLLSRQNDELIKEGSDLAVDLERAYGRIANLKKEREKAVRDLTRARMLQIRQDSRRAKLLLDGGKNPGNTQPGNGGSDKSLDASKSALNQDASSNTNKSRSWLSRLSVNFKASTTNECNHDSFSSTTSFTKQADPSSSALTKTTSTATISSLSSSTRNLFNNSTLSFLSSELGNEAPVGQNHSNSSLALNEILPGKRPSMVQVDGASSSNAGLDASASANCRASPKCQRRQQGRYSHRNTDKDVREFLSRHSLPSDASLFGESDSEEEFDDYVVQQTDGQDDDHKDGHDGCDGGDAGDFVDEGGRDKELDIDIVKEGKGVGATAVALDACRLPKRLSLNAREA